MMGEQKSEPELFNYAVNLEKRVRSNHPLQQVKAAIDYGFVREEVAHCYGKKGNESVDPVVILKMMFLLFFDDIKSERELMEVIGERLDYLWFLDYGLDEKVHSSAKLSVLVVRLLAQHLLHFRTLPAQHEPTPTHCLTNSFGQHALNI
jgi:transposase